MSEAPCRSCGRSMLWATVRNPDGAEVKMPLDARPVQSHLYVVEDDADADGRLMLRASVASRSFGDQGRPVYVSHFLTCPQAAQHSRGRG